MGTTYGAERWKTVTWSATGWICGTNWIALAPVPMTPTRLPRRSTPWSHVAEWKAGPANRSAPSIRGIAGRDSCPTAQTKTSTSHETEVSPRTPSTRQRPVVSSQWAEVTSVWNSTSSSRPRSAAVRSM